MWVLFIAILVISSVCENIAFDASKGKLLSEQQRRKAIYAIITNVALGLVLCTIYDFNVTFYEYNEVDFWDYGELTTEGVLFFAMKLCGMVNIASSLIIGSAVAVKDIKGAFLVDKENEQN